MRRPPDTLFMPLDSERVLLPRKASMPLRYAPYAAHFFFFAILPRHDAAMPLPMIATMPPPMPIFLRLQRYADTLILLR